jgi:hypothetical protein
MKLRIETLSQAQQEAIGAQCIAIMAHTGHFRRDGFTPYIKHVEAVVSRVAGDLVAEAVAWLHDLIEDTGLTVDDLRDLGISEYLVELTVAMTRTPDVPYGVYLAGIKNNPITKKVKIADILSNLADKPTDKQIVKYSKALLFLMGESNEVTLLENMRAEELHKTWDTMPT